MKKIIYVIILVASQWTFAASTCEDFSGKYSVGGIIETWTQTGCVSLEISFRGVSLAIALDGKVRQLNDPSDFHYYTTNSIEENQFRRNEVYFRPGKSTEIAEATYVKLANGDLEKTLIRHKPGPGDPETSVYILKKVY